MNDLLCLTCGASWRCEHTAHSDDRGLRYVPPDGPTARAIGIEVARLGGEEAGAAFLAQGDEAGHAVAERAAAMRQFAMNIAALTDQPASTPPAPASPGR